MVPHIPARGHTSNGIVSYTGPSIRMGIIIILFKLQYEIFFSELLLLPIASKLFAVWSVVV